ncbi:hypothetical protein K2P96_00135 [Patescibacteria group bacterium]|nr:hypothetical protein [Patescibacteria group bacterium]
MHSENRNCQNCKKDFIIEAEDFNFYEKVKVPAPTWCPECRMVRRFTTANAWSLFWRNCDKCGKKMLSMYEPDKKITVYCQPCWWADDWDGTEYAMDYDPKRSFFDQLKELTNKTPHSTFETEYLTLKNCDYSNAIAYSKNCYLTFFADYCENVFYSSILNGMKSSLDCLRGWESELCYGSTGFAKGYRVFFTENFDSCVDVWFSRNCYSCSNCIGCVNLRGAKYQIFNVQYTREEYEQKIKEFNLDTWTGQREVEKQARAFWKTKPYREYNGNTFNLDVTGEYTYFSKNSKEGYMVNYVENCKYCQMITVSSSKECMDYTSWGNGVELIYDTTNVGAGVSNVKFSGFCFPDVVNTEYSWWCPVGKNNFGCVNLKRRSYSILNKQYSKEEYEKLREQIIEDMKNNPYKDEKGRVWSYGEFFQPVFGLFAYNHSNAQKFMPKTKEQAISEGYEWSDFENPTNPASIKSELLPETIKEVSDLILNEVIECGECKRGFKIVKGELDLLRTMGLPVPHECPKCRENERFARENKPGMYHRNCMKCEAPIYTPYSSERPEIVYCVKCYQAEFA